MFNTLLTNRVAIFWFYLSSLSFVCFYILFQVKELLSTFLVMQFLWWWTLSAFVCLGKPLILLHRWMLTWLDDRVLFTDIFCLSLFWIYYFLSPGPFPLRNLMIAWWGFLCRLLSFSSLAVFVIPPLSLAFDSLNIKCLREGVFCLFALR